MSREDGAAFGSPLTANTIVLVALLVPLAMVLLSVALSPTVNWTALVAVAGFCVLGIASPANALLVTTALLGFGIILSALLGVPALRVPEVLVVASIATSCVRALVGRPAFRSALIARMSAPVALFALAAVAAGVVALRVHQVQTDYPSAYMRSLISFLAHDYFIRPDKFFELVAIAAIVEGLALYAVVAALCQVERDFFKRGVRMLAVGGAGLAMMSIVRLAEIILRDPNAVDGLRASYAGLRISPQIPDYIAAGSYFALCWLAGMGAAIASPRRRLWWIVVVGAPLLAGLYLTGSRSVIFAALGGFGVLAGVLLRERNAATLRVVGLVAIVLVVILLSFRWMVGHDLLGPTASDSVTVRVELVKAGLRVMATQPLFGVGVGRFHLLVGRFASPELNALWAGRLNPHNDFLRFAAELGVVGLGLFVWILASAGRRIWRALRTTSDPYLAGLSAGLVAFLLTSLASNPLMLPNISFAFWMALGLAVGRAGRPMPADDAADSKWTSPVFWSRRWRGAAVFVIGALLVISIPFRAARNLGDVDFTHVTYGLEWREDPDGTARRWSGSKATLFVEGPARLVEIPLCGTLPSGAIQQVEIRVNGRPADRAAVGAEWRRVHVVLPQAGATSPWRIDLLVSPTWVPALANPDNQDWREAGVKLGEVRVLLRAGGGGR